MPEHTVDLAASIRLRAMEMTHRGGASHIGSGLSIADIMAVLYGRVLRVDPSDPTRYDRDRLVVSKGHAAAVVYATLAVRNFFPESWLADYHQDGQLLGGHVTAHGIPGVEVSTGSLGHGLPVGLGMALASQRFGPPYRVFVVLSDGECDEGSVWEAALLASHHGVDNLIAIIDYNKLQSLDTVERTVRLEPLGDKWRAFGWEVREIDGHDHDELLKAFSAVPRLSGRPTCFVAHTVKGKGVPEMENRVEWHYRSPSADQIDWAKKNWGPRG
ncbi:MAG TPA: transketolase [Acidimicrobiia bacterium]|nr:transketolase [Acidimicrobiia bacterium]